MGRVADIAVEGRALRSRRRREREPAVRVEVERAGIRLARRPRAEGTPAVAPRLEDRRLRLLERALVLQIEGEEWRLDAGAIVLPGRRAEIDLPQLLAGPAGPPAVPPRADDEEVARLVVVRLERAVDRHRSVEVLLVPPPRDVERRHGDARQIRPHRLPLPEGVVVGGG